MSGCNALADGTGVVNCDRLGGDVIILAGVNFGPGLKNVLVSGTTCRVLTTTDKNVTCRLPPMPVGHPTGNQIIMIQATGGLLIADLSVASVSYRQCPPGQMEVGRTCQICGFGQFSLSFGSPTCSKCSAGTYGSSAGLSACAFCPFGTYSADQATACASCPPGTL